ncbi:MAG: hypothetical protein K9L61_04945 [Candidatus Omnitrophica bacterium]|nr:hypothetical protein [Candidatus Omnitrophota bacterium]
MKKRALCLNKEKVLFGAFLSVLIVYPYLFVLNMIIPSSLLGGKNVYIYGVTIIIIIIFGLRWKFISRVIPLEVVFLLMYFIAIIAFLNLFFYSNIKHIDVLKIPLNLVIYIGVAYSLTANIKNRKILYNVILYSCLVQAVVGIIHYFYFPYIMTGLGGSRPAYVIADITTATAQAERGTLGNPNVYSLFLLLGCFLVVYRQKYFRKKWIIEIVYLLTLITALVLSDSRFGLVLSLLLFLIYFSRLKVKRKVIVSLLAGFLIFSFYGLIEEKVRHAYHSTFLRDKESNKYHLDRISKNKNALDLLVMDSGSILIGPSKEETYQFKVVENNIYSDNSFFLLFHNYGIPTTIIMIFIMWFVYYKTIDIKKRGTILFFIYFLAALWLYNSILFDIWLLFFSSSLMVLSRRNSRGGDLLSYGS